MPAFWNWRARRPGGNIDAMLSPEFDAIVSNAAGCGSVMKEYAGSAGARSPSTPSRAKQFVAKVRDITEYLAEVGLLEPKRKLTQRVTYADPCHLAHAQGIRKAPRELLKAIGAELVEMPRADYLLRQRRRLQRRAERNLHEDSRREDGIRGQRQARRLSPPPTWDACCSSPPE